MPILNPLTNFGRIKRRLRYEYYHLIKPSVVRWHGIKLALGDHMSPGCAEAIFMHYYEREEAEIVDRFLEPEDVVFELGTGIGAISLLCAKKIGAGRVHTYEANPRLEPHILKNFGLNHLKPHHQICLLADEPGEADFFAASSFELSSAVRPGDNATAVKTPTKSLAQELRRVDPTFLIVDIEGGEAQVFDQLEDYGRITKLSVELHAGIIGADAVERIKHQIVARGFTIDPVMTVNMQLFATRRLPAS